MGLVGSFSLHNDSATYLSSLSLASMAILAKVFDKIQVKKFYSGIGLKELEIFNS